MYITRHRVAGGAVMSTLIAESLSRVRPERVRWLWEPYLPRGKLAVLDGDPGIGKSLLTTDLAARLSRGGPLPGGASAGRPHVTLPLNAEDDPADTPRPRAEAAGADLDRVVAVANAAGAVPSLGYRLTSTAGGVATVEWLGPVAVTADALAADPDAPLRPRDRASDWLRAELAAGPRPAAEVYAAASAAGIPDRTL